MKLHETMRCLSCHTVGSTVHSRTIAETSPLFWMKFEQFHSTLHVTSCNILRLQDPASVSYLLKCFKSCLWKRINKKKRGWSSWKQNFAVKVCKLLISPLRGRINLALQCSSIHARHSLVLVLTLFFSIFLELLHQPSPSWQLHWNNRTDWQVLWGTVLLRGVHTLQGIEIEHAMTRQGHGILRASWSWIGWKMRNHDTTCPNHHTSSSCQPLIIDYH